MGLEAALAREYDQAGPRACHGLITRIPRTWALAASGAVAMRPLWSYTYPALAVVVVVVSGDYR